MILCKNIKLIKIVENLIKISILQIFQQLTEDCVNLIKN